MLLLPKGQHVPAKMEIRSRKTVSYRGLQEEGAPSFPEEDKVVFVPFKMDEYHEKLEGVWKRCQVKVLETTEKLLKMITEDK